MASALITVQQCGGVPESERGALGEAHEAERHYLTEWRRRHLGEDTKEESMLDAMLPGVWTFAGWLPEMIDRPGTPL